MTTNTETTEVAQRFIEALNARDTDALGALVADDSQFLTPTGKALSGLEGVEKLIVAAEDAGVTLADAHDEAVTPTEDGHRVVVPLDVFVRGSRLPGSAEFRLRDGKVACFEVTRRE